MPQDKQLHRIKLKDVLTKMDFIPKSSRIATAILLLPHQACLRAPRKFFNKPDFFGLNGSVPRTASITHLVLQGNCMRKTLFWRVNLLHFYCTHS